MNKRMNVFGRGIIFRTFRRQGSRFFASEKTATTTTTTNNNMKTLQ